MTPNFRCKFKKHSQSCWQDFIYIILFQSLVDRYVCDVINFIINVILSNLLVSNFEDRCIIVFALC